MAKAKTAIAAPAFPTAAQIATTTKVEAKVPGTTVPAGYGADAAELKPAVINPAILSDKDLIAKTNADNKAKADLDKIAAKKVKDDAKAEKAAAADKVKAEKAEARAIAKTARETRIAALATEGKNYTGSMLALADRAKTGAYVKGATGQLRSNDELAIALDGISATDVVRIGLDLLKVEDNPYTALNIGQQSMNLRNRMRGAIKKATLTIADIAAYIERNKIVVVTQADVDKARAEKKARADEAKAAALVKAEAAAKAAEAAKVAPVAEVKPLAEPETNTVLKGDGSDDAQPAKTKTKAKAK